MCDVSIDSRKRHLGTSEYRSDTLRNVWNYAGGVSVGRVAGSTTRGVKSGKP